MRICVCVDMRYGMAMLAKMYMNAMDMDMELRATVNITLVSNIVIEAVRTSLSERVLRGRGVPKLRCEELHPLHIFVVGWPCEGS